MEISELDSDQQSALNDGLNFAARVASKDRPLNSKAVQELYDGFLNENISNPEAIIALGLSFGQLFVEYNEFEWVRVSDEYGEETVVSPKGWRTICSPISMIQKRLERNEQVNIINLYEHTLSSIRRIIEDGADQR